MVRVMKMATVLKTKLSFCIVIIVMSEVLIVFSIKMGAFPWEALGQNAILSCLSCNSFSNKTGAFSSDALGKTWICLVCFANLLKEAS